MRPIDSEADPAATAANNQQNDQQNNHQNDLQSLLAGSLRNLADTTRSRRACAWAIRPNGETFVIAAAFRDAGVPEAPDAGSLAALESAWREGRPLDLGAGGKDSPLAALARRHGFSSCGPIQSPDGEPLAMLFLGGDDDAPGAVRPRTLAALEGAIQRLQGPLMTEAARVRLSQLGDEISRLDRLASLGDLLAEVAHEVRNPLVSIKTFLELLPDYRDDDEFNSEYRQLVLGEVARMERLLGNLIQHAQPNRLLEPQGTNRHECDVAEILTSMIRLLNQRALDRDVMLRIQVAEDLPHPAISEDDLRQVLLNVTLNALEAAPAQTEVIVRAKVAASGLLEIEIEDHGEGVPEATRARVFEPFFSTRADRTGGLGLAISKKLVNEADGSISVEDAEAGGAIFRLSLPLSA